MIQAMTSFSRTLDGRKNKRKERSKIKDQMRAHCEQLQSIYNKQSSMY